MTASAPLAPDDVLTGLVTYQTDDQARPGRVVEALAALLISMASRRKQTEPAGVATNTEGRT